MLGIGRACRDADGLERDERAGDVGEGLDGIGDHGVAVAEDAGGELDHGQRGVGDDAEDDGACGRGAGEGVRCRGWGWGLGRCAGMDLRIAHGQ